MKDDFERLLREISGMLDMNTEIRENEDWAGKALKDAGYTIDEHTNMTILLYEDDKARSVAWQAFSKKYPEEAKLTERMPCAMCGKAVGKSPISIDTEMWCKRDHIPMYLVNRERRKKDAAIGVLAINPDGTKRVSSIDEMMAAVKSGIVENFTIPPLPKALAEHRCDNPNCPVKKIQELKEISDKKALDQLGQLDKDGDPTKWN